jgi:hypothetical protein
MHRLFRQSLQRPGRRGQATAAVLVALVLLLDVLSSSPEAHAWIHGHCGCTADNANASGSVMRLLNVLGASPQARAWVYSHAASGANASCNHNHGPANPNDDGCIVTLFAQGVVAATVFAALIFALFRLGAVTVRAGEAFCLLVPHYLLPPLCGPPQS